MFLLVSVVIVIISWPSLRHPHSHGYYRFFSWEAILGLLLLNLRGWFSNPFAWFQVISWILLVISLILILTGVILLRRVGKPTDALEATTRLVTKGIYHYIRHPLYASLLFLTLGIFFKSPSFLDGCITVVAMAFLFATARADETECMLIFGQEYALYMHHTKMFIPFVF